MKNSITVSIGGVDVSDKVVYPVKWSDQLDERLDETRLSLRGASQKIISPLSRVEMNISDGEGNSISRNVVITTDESTELPVGGERYNHEIACLEETKILEGIVIDALSFTNNLGRSYDGEEGPVLPDPGVISQDQGKEEDKTFTNTDYVSPLRYGDTLTIAAAKDLFPFFDGEYGSSFASGTRTVTIDGEIIYTDRQRFEKTTSRTIPVEWDVCVIKYQYQRGGIVASNPYDFTLTAVYTISTAEDVDPTVKWTVKTVIDRLLDVAEPHLKGIKPRFSLDATQAAELDKIISPEFAFPRGTLKEALDQIGGFIHGVPRLKGNIISFDMLGGTEEATLSKENAPYVTAVRSQDVEDYCFRLDSAADNLACMLDQKQGTVIEPYDGGYKTVRTETVYARIEDGNLIIPTQWGIGQIISVKSGFTEGHGAVEDITGYVFEKAEYDTMDAYSGAYPKSRSFAIYYTQGQPNIKGLDFKPATANSWQNVQTRYAIVNILNRVTKGDAGVTITNYPTLAFEVAYIPVFNARVQHSKSYIGDITEPRTLIYNQSANVIETRYYGENLKGTVERMGNVEEVKTYYLDSLSKIPKAGQIFGEYYAASVICELYGGFLKCTVGLSKDFNRLSQYIGINSTPRFYQVSEKQAYQRDIKYVDYVVFGDPVETDDTLLYSIAPIANIFSGGTADSISCAVAQGLAEDGKKEGRQVLLPVTSVALGNGMLFTFSYEDSFSAGTQAQYHSGTDVTGYFTNSVQYGNRYGRMHGLNFKLYRYLPYPKNFEAQTDVGTRLPSWTGIEGDGGADYRPLIVTPTDKPLVIEKDGSEIISVSYMLQFVSNDRRLILGSAMARLCPLVKSGTRSNCVIYTLPHRIGKFDNVLDLTGAKSAGYLHYTANANGKSITFENFNGRVGDAAWAVVYKDTNELMFGANEIITADEVQMPTATLRHDIFNLYEK